MNLVYSQLFPRNSKEGRNDRMVYREARRTLPDLLPAGVPPSCPLGTHRVKWVSLDIRSKHQPELHASLKPVSFVQGQNVHYPERTGGG